MITIGNKTYKGVIVFDLDDTLIDLKTELYRVLDENYGDAQYVPHWSEWDVYHVETTVGCTHEDLVRMAENDKTWRVTKPHLFSKYILRELRLMGYYVVILTARNNFVPDAFNETEVYLKANDLEYDELIVSDVGSNKMDWLKHHDQILLTIDDSMRNCRDFKDSGKVEHVVLHAMPNNKGCAEFPRVHNLYQIFPILDIAA